MPNHFMLAPQARSLQSKMSLGARHLVRWTALGACLCLTHCPEPDPKGDDEVAEPPPEEHDETEPDEPDEPECPPARADNSPPAYTWEITLTTAGSAEARYTIPDSPIGLVMLFDGGNGSASWFTHMETRLQAEALVAEGFAVLALDAVAADHEYDFEPSPELNVDLQNLSAALALREGLGIPTDRLYYLGFSSGGTFASIAARSFPVAALALFNVRGVFAFESEPLPPPTVWVVAENDVLVPPDDAGLLDNQDAMSAFGIDWAAHLNEQTAAAESVFTRIASPTEAVSGDDSSDAVAQLIASGDLDECGVPTRIDIGADDFVPGPSFTQALRPEAQRQLNELYAAHAITSDFRHEVATFLATH